MKDVTKSGRTVEEAIEAALAELNTSRDHVDINVLEEAKKGLFGLVGSKPAVVQVTVKNDPVKAAKSYLTSIVAQMGVTVDIQVSESGGDTVFTCSSEQIGMFIGKRGNTLNALQYLVNVFANFQTEERLRIILDAENYRARRKETLKQLAFRLADKAEKKQKNVFLEPMPSIERKVIHTALQDVAGVTTYSKGKDPNRRVVITYSK